MVDYKYENVRIEIRDGIGWATLNRPEKRNAMSPELHDDMDDALQRLEFDDDVKVLVVSGAGGNFSAGQDLKKFFRELEGKPLAQKRSRDTANRWRWERLYHYQKPTIAMVEGYCVGGAFMQLIGCDFAVAAENAIFCLSEINWGNIPGSLVAKVVADALLPRHAQYYACLGEQFDGSEAARVGLINRAVPPAMLQSAVEELARKLMKKSPAALRATKHAMRDVRTMDTVQAYAYLNETVKALAASDKENSRSTGMRQFLDDKSYRPAQEAYDRSKTSPGKGSAKE